MGKARTIDYRTLRSDGHANSLTLNLGEAAKLIEEAEPGKTARVSLLEDGTIEVEVVDK
jgi:hypothetical protein